MHTPIYNPRAMGATCAPFGVRCRVWAPFAHKISVVGEFNDWDGEKHDVIGIASFSNQPVEVDYRIGLPQPGDWLIRFNS